MKDKKKPGQPGQKKLARVYRRKNSKIKNELDFKTPKAKKKYYA